MADTLNVYRGGNDDLTPPHAGGGGKVALIILALCVVLGGLGYWFVGGTEEPVPAAVPDAGAPPPPPKPTLPSPSESDPRVRSLLTPASSDPLWAEYLKQSDLVRVFVSATNNVAQGESPRTRLFFLKPEGEFEVTEKTDRRRKTKKQFIAPASYARYDAVAAVVGSLDEQVVASAYVALKEWIDLAYEEIAPRNARFETIWQAAVDRLTRVPVPEGQVEVVPKGALFAFADPALEGLSAPEKHLLRMGAKNQKVIQEKLAAIAEAITAASAATTDGGTATDGGMTSADGGEQAAATGTGMAGEAQPGAMMTGDAGATDGEADTEEPAAAAAGATPTADAAADAGAQ